MDKKEPVAAVTYTIPLPLYQQFAVKMAEQKFATRRKKNQITSLIEMLVALLLTTWVLVSEEKNPIVIVLCVSLMGLGVYSFSFYRFIFPASVKKNAAENYQKSQYLKNPVTLRFYPDRVEEVAGDLENSYKWQEITAMRKGEGLYAIELGPRRTLLVPVEELLDEKYLVEELLSTVCQKYKVKEETL